MERPPNVVFYPELPHPRTTVLRILAELGVAPARRIDDRTICAFQWKDTTCHALPDRAIELLSRVPLYNVGCTDISKRHVARCNRVAFGRSLAVDPLTCHGPIVCKSDRNAAQDGYVVNGPLATADSAKTYSLLIDNIDGDVATDHRVFVVGVPLPVVLERRKPRERRFRNAGPSVVARPTSDVFAPSEIQQLRLFTAAIGMDMGELDVLRDRMTGLVWVVDANNTPRFPDRLISAEDARTTLGQLAEAFEAAFLSP